MLKNILGLLLLIGVVNAEYLRDNSKNVVLDTSTNLMWQDNTVTITATMSWSDSIEHCEILSFGGFSDWRLPNINELTLLVDVTESNPSIDSVFINAHNGTYWSSSDYQATSDAWVVNFYYGYSPYNAMTSYNYVRCVRGGF